MSKAIKRTSSLESAGEDQAGIPIGSNPVVDEFISEPSKDLAKVVTNDQTPQCPYCHSKNLQALGPRTGASAFENVRCANCRKQFRVVPEVMNKIA